VKDRRKYDIAILQLKNTQHEFDFEIEDAFFQLFDQELIDKGSLNAHLLLDKNETFLEFKFKIVGSVELVCDRSLEKFDFDLDLEKAIIFKYGTEEAELTEEIMVIPMDTSIINVAQYIFEFISLGIPIKKLHPKFEMEGDVGELVYSSDEGMQTEQLQSDPAEENDVDPRWDDLKKLKTKGKK